MENKKEIPTWHFLVIAILTSLAGMGFFFFFNVFLATDDLWYDLFQSMLLSNLLTVVLTIILTLKYTQGAKK